MSIDTWLEQKLRRWQQLREEGQEVSANELCADDAEVRARPEIHDELKQAILRLKQHEGLLGELHQEPAGTSTLLQRDYAHGQRRLHETHPTQSTIDQRAMESPGAEHESGIPETIGRYRIDGVLGQGGFGRVFLAYDEQLQRRVAIKVPHARLVSCPEDAEAHLKEARTAAELDHPNIAPVYDVGSTDQFPFFVVSKLIDGRNLSERIKEARFSRRESAELVATVAEALHYVHRRGLVHRDVKPANILIDAEGTPYVVDFGLALKEHELGSGPGFAGTPAYMSPEQARGEGHLVDGRTDIFSLGVVFYELLTGHHPFRKSSWDALREQITRVEVRPLRQRDDTIAKELERICLKALAKRATDRYTTGLDMAEDLRLFLEESKDQEQPRRPKTPSVPAPAVAEAADDPAGPPGQIVPKGLRSFDAEDADFFLELLPGARDRNGLPEIIRFWKVRIEQTDPARTFRVGLIYGPSGCGKSSMVKAGLLPRLDKHVVPLYIQATGQETELRLLHGLRRGCSTLPKDLDLNGALTALRRGRGIPDGRKVVIILDQFEQWLHAKREEEISELAQALRQCDGARVQCIVMVRDDFWMATTRFMCQLETPLVEGHNSAAVDLFDLDHAQKVLTAFGIAYGRLPEKAGQTKASHRSFVAQAVSALAQDGKVVCVRLALFVEMMKGRPWETASLRQIGGVEGVGVTFLEETFSSRTAPPQHRFHQLPARAVLQALLPESGADIKGHMRSYEELLEVSSYADRPTDFGELINILDGELRLITPTDPEGSESADDTGQADRRERFYQLTHDFLVPPVREWLIRKRKQTRRGRAELRLSDRAAAWNAKPENRHLPSLWEFINICCFTKKTNRSKPQGKMLRRATGYHVLRVSLAALVITIVATLGSIVYRRGEAVGLVEQLLAAEIEQVPRIVTALAPYRQWADSALEATIRNAEVSGREKLRASLGLLPVDGEQVAYLCDRLLQAEPAEVPVIRDMFKEHSAAKPKVELVQRCWTVLEKPQHHEGGQRLRAACVLAVLDPDRKRWGKIADDVAAQLVSVRSAFLSHWLATLRPARDFLIRPLGRVFRTPNNSVLQRSMAAEVLADYAADDAQTLVSLIVDADAGQFGVLFPVLSERHGPEAVGLLGAELKPYITAKPPVPERGVDADAKRQANAAVALLRMGQSEKVWPLLKHRLDPRVRSYLIHRFVPMGASPQTLVRRLGEETDDTIRQALILALGEFGAAAFSQPEQQAVVSQLLEWYENDPDPGVHGAADWLLRKWKKGGKIKEIDDKLKEMEKPRHARQAKFRRGWFVNSQGQTMVINGPVEFLMGSHDRETEREDDEYHHKVRLTYSYAISAKEVTVAEFERYMKAENPNEWEARLKETKTRAPAPECPFIGVDWYDAAKYCNWLSKNDDIPKDQWCYVPDKDSNGRLKPAADFLNRQLRGYRLATEAEWEYACRGGTATAWNFGETEELLGRYGWYLHNEGKRTRPVGLLKPNAFGLFDMHGNVYEWCQDWYQFEYYKEPRAGNDPPGPASASRRMLRGGGWFSVAGYCRSAFRNSSVPGFRSDYVGFRVAAVHWVKAE